VLSQQPVGHDVASHRQAPPTQRWPALQAAVAPHRHPPAPHPSARVASHPTQVTPPVPQVASAGALQVAPEQQPPAQLVLLQPLQRPPAQVWPAGQDSQAPPPAPQEVSSSPPRQSPPEQHP
jgi:hypothetical protein